MKINKFENITLWETLFSESNYQKWAPFFTEFIRTGCAKIKAVAGVMTPSSITVDDRLVSDFADWLREKDVNVEI